MKMRLCLVVAVILLCAAGFASTRRVEAVGGCIPGSYLAIEESGTQSLWTFSSDGTFQASSSAERVFGFSHIQGSWEHDGAHSARAVGLDFGFGQEFVGDGVPPQWVTRIDGLFAFSRNCEQFDGPFELRFYDATDDPLDESAVEPAGSDTLTARRIEVP